MAVTPNLFSRIQFERSSFRVETANSLNDAILDDAASGDRNVHQYEGNIYKQRKGRNHLEHK